MDFFSAMRIASTGLSVQRTRINVTSSNLANVETTRTEQGGPYRRREVLVAAVPLSETFGEILEDVTHDKVAGAEVVAVESAPEEQVRLVYDPQHPDANQDGYVAMPDINPVDEMVNMLTAQRSYEAGVSALRAIKGMANEALNIGQA
jgi:flagellar basal-body rod protein FlgC